MTSVPSVRSSRRRFMARLPAGGGPRRPAPSGFGPGSGFVASGGNAGKRGLAGKAPFGLAGLLVVAQLGLGCRLGCPSTEAGLPGLAAAGASPSAAAPATLPPSLRWTTLYARLAQGDGGSSAPYAWKPVRIGGGGFVTGLVVHPLAPGVVYARTDVGGAYRWSEPERRWTQLVTATRMPAAVVDAADGDLGGGMRRTRAYHVESLGLSPREPRVLYLALGDELRRDGWVVKSSDGGDSFRLLPLAVPMGGNQAFRTVGERFAVDPNDSRVVYFGSRNQGLHRSLDGGDTWSRIAGLPSGQPLDNTAVGVAVVKFDASAGTDEAGRTRRLYASVAGAGLFRSEDAGVTWMSFHAGFAVALEVSGGVLYAALRGAGVLRCAAGGGCADISPRRERNVEGLAVASRDSRRILAVTDGFQKLFRSTDAGASWTLLGTSNQPRQRHHFRSPRIPWVEHSTVRHWLSIGELVFDPHQPERVWFAEGMGVWRSDNAGADAPDFDNVSEGIEETVATGLAAANGTLVVTAWDRIGFQFSDPDRYPTAQLGLSGEFANGSSVDGTAAGVFAVVTSDIRFCCGDGNFSGYSLDSGASWHRFGSTRTGSNTPKTLKFGELVVSPANPANMVWAPRLNEPKLFHTSDFGRSWTQASISGFTSGTAPHLTTQKILAADPVARGQFYAYSWEPGRLYVSSDGGARWTGATGMLPTGAWHGQLRAAPGQSGHLWFCTGPDHRRDPAERGLFTSSDAGAIFAKLGGIQECWGLGFGKPAPGAAYPTLFLYGRVGERWGVHRSTDEGATWVNCGEYPLGLFAEVASVAGDPTLFGRVYVGFKGAGFAYGDVAR